LRRDTLRGRPVEVASGRHQEVRRQVPQMRQGAGVRGRGRAGEALQELAPLEEYSFNLVPRDIVR